MGKPYMDWNQYEQETLAKFLEDPKNKNVIKQLGNERCFICGKQAKVSFLFSPPGQAIGIMSLCPSCQDQLLEILFKQASRDN